MTLILFTYHLKRLLFIVDHPILRLPVLPLSQMPHSPLYLSLSLLQ